MKTKVLRESLNEVKKKIKNIEESVSSIKFSEILNKFEYLILELSEKSEYGRITAIVSLKHELVNSVCGFYSSEEIEKKYKSYIKNLEKFKNLYPNVKLKSTTDMLDVVLGQSKMYPTKTFEDTIKNKEKLDIFNNE